VNMSFVTPHKRSASVAFPTPETMATKKNKRYRKGVKKTKKRAQRAIKSSTTTFQKDRSLEYRSKPYSGAAKRRDKFEKRVLKAMQSKMAPTNIILNQIAFGLNVPILQQNVWTAMMWSANGIATSNDIFQLYAEVGGPTSATQGYAYDLYLHHGILEMDICLETSGGSAQQGFIDVYTIKCRKDVRSENPVSTSGSFDTH